MNKIVAGLGNPGQKYQKTRHNVGFLIVDSLKSGKVNFQKSAANKLFLTKPQMGMNSSGIALKKVVEKGNVVLDNLLVVHDDLDLSLGDFRLQKGRGSAGHRGVRSVIETLGSQDFWRLRVGIGRPLQGGDPANYVLEKFTFREWGLLDELIQNKLILSIREWVER